MGRTVKVDRGPSREDLFDSLRLYNERRQFEVTFMNSDVSSIYKMRVYMIKVESETEGTWSGVGLVGQSKATYIFNTRNHTGTLTFLD